MSEKDTSKIKEQLAKALEDMAREPSMRTKGYIEALRWVLNED